MCVCFRCRNKVYPSHVKGYKYQCFVHDEDLYGIETIKITQEKYLEELAMKLHCTIKEAKEISSKYDHYVYENMKTGNYPFSIRKFHNIEKKKERTEKQRG